MRCLVLVIFHQTNPSGPTEGSLEPFSILANFQVVIDLFKRLPGPGVTSKIMKYGKLKKGNKRICIVNENSQRFLKDCCFKGCSNGLKFEKNSE